VEAVETVLSVCLLPVGSLCVLSSLILAEVVEFLLIHNLLGASIFLNEVVGLLCQCVWPHTVLELTMVCIFFLLCA